MPYCSTGSNATYEYTCTQYTRVRVYVHVYSSRYNSDIDSMLLNSVECGVWSVECGVWGVANNILSTGSMLLEY